MPALVVENRIWHVPFELNAVSYKLLVFSSAAATGILSVGCRIALQSSDCSASWMALTVPNILTTVISGISLG